MSGPPHPDPDGLDAPPYSMGGCHYQGYGGSYGGSPRYHGGLAPSIMPSAFLLLVRRSISGVLIIFQEAFLWQFLLSSTV